MSTETLLAEIRDALVELVTLTKTQKPLVAWPGEKTIADDKELDHPKYGDPVVKSAPRDWTGPFEPGRHMSEYPAEFLDLLADRYEFFALKNDKDKVVTEKGVPKSKWDRLAAAKARGWAQRLRTGYKRPETPLMSETGFDDSDIPFMWFIPILLAAQIALVSVV